MKNLSWIVNTINYYQYNKVLYYNKLCKFDNVLNEVYEYIIESYQVIQSYWKRRKGRFLIIDEIEHIERVIKVIHYTINIQKKIDLIISKINEFNDDWWLR